jgi:hypothetical protein
VLQYLLSSIYRPVNNDIEITGRVATMTDVDGGCFRNASQNK